MEYSVLRSYSCTVYSVSLCVCVLQDSCTFTLASYYRRPRLPTRSAPVPAWAHPKIALRPSRLCQISEWSWPTFGTSCIICVWFLYTDCSAA